MIQFLFQGGHGSHGPRAQALANITPGSRYGDIDITKASAIPGLHTLTFWGHGDSGKLCGKSPNEIHTIIKAWKRVNGGLKTIEILTCNSRHASGGDSFANKLKSQFGMLSGTGGLTLKALPVTVTGKMNAWSILLAETVHNSWVYNTAPGANDSLLMQANSLIQFTTNDTGGMVSFRGDIASPSQRNGKESSQ